MPRLPFDDRPIGVFDSGMGGLTVLGALRRVLPAEDFVYLGDTARLPYGTKSAETVVRYALQAARALAAREVKMLVVACNTASAHALAALRQAFPGTPVLGVVEPGAGAAVGATRAGRIAVIATEGTVASGAYVHAIHRLSPKAQVSQQACALFVALVEEGWTGNDVAEATARRYLAPLFDRSAEERPDTLVLGCTHFPVLKPMLRRVLGEAVAIIDSAEATAAAAVAELKRLDLARQGEAAGTERLLATDAAERFRRVARAFAIDGLEIGGVEVVDL